MLRKTVLVLTAGLAAASAGAQIQPRRFAPPDYTTEFRVDMAAVVDSGLWDLVERSPARILLAKFRDDYGFDLADLDRLRLTQQVDPAPEGAQSWQRRRQQVWVFEGSERVGRDGLAESVLERHPIVENVGGIALLRSEDLDDEIAVPRPGVMVIGSTMDHAAAFEQRPTTPGVVGRIIRGELQGGTPVPDLMALTASPRALLLLAGVTSPGMPMTPEYLAPFPAAWFVADDLPQGLRVQLARAADDDERLVLEVLVRFAAPDSAGARTLVERFAASRNAWAEDPELAPLATAFAPVTTRIDGPDAIATLDLGTEREMAAKLSPLLLLMLRAVAFDSAEAAEAVVEVQAAPAPPEPPRKHEHEHGGKQQDR